MLVVLERIELHRPTRLKEDGACMLATNLAMHATEPVHTHVAHTVRTHRACTCMSVSL